jgi:Polyglycine hydrolase-like, structural repeat
MTMPLLRIEDALRTQLRASGRLDLPAWLAQPSARLRQPEGFDDGNDTSAVVAQLSAAERIELGLARPRPLAPPTPIPTPAGPTPTYHVRVHACLCTDDNGTGHGAAPNAITPSYLKDVLKLANDTFAQAGLLLEYSSFEKVSSTDLNREFVVPPEWDLARPESHPPWVDVDSETGGRSGFFTCVKCQALYLRASGAGICPKGGAHDAFVSPGVLGVDFSVVHDHPLGHTQSGWRHCLDCHALFFGGHGDGVCAAGGGHRRGKADLRVFHDGPYLNHRDADRSFRWCHRCQALFRSQEGPGCCPAGGQHDASKSGDYTVLTQQGNVMLPSVLARQAYGREHRHSLVLLLCQGAEVKWVDGAWRALDARTYDYSGGAVEFVALHPLKWPDPKELAYQIGHEAGHYFHLAHTHGPQPESLAELQTILRRELESGRRTKADVHRTLDGDWGFGVRDTPADPSSTLIASLVGNDTKSCGPVGTAKLTVTYTDPTSKQPDSTTVTLTPDRSNALSYFKHCLTFAQTYSGDQVRRIRHSIEEAAGDEWLNRWHTCHPALRLKTLDAYVVGNQVRYAATWHPSTQGEIQVYDWDQKSLRAKYDELWPQGWRLKTLDAYVVGNQVRYAATWHPSTEGEIQVYDWPLDEIRTRYGMWW